MFAYIHKPMPIEVLCSHVDDFNTRNKCLTAKLASVHLSSYKGQY